jgi:acetate kinase
MNILIINAGSSSIKFKIFRCHKGKATLLVQGQVSNVKQNPALLTIKNVLDGSNVKEELVLQSNVYESAVEYLTRHSSFVKYSLDVIINRVVHGGDEYKDIVLLHEKTIAALSKFSELAPLQQPYNLLIAKYFMQLYPKLKHYACFDTGFHHTIPLINRVYAIPWQYTEGGIKRYGFHGLSYQYISSRLSAMVEHKIAKGRWVIAHLGSGSSLCGIKNGKSVVTSMGFSVLEGVPMASRCGDLDPAIPMYLANKYKLAPDEISDVLYHKSGLLGLSNNISNDMAVLVSSKEPVAKFAVEFFCLQVALYITKFATALGGIDGIVFTGGVGENSAPVRSLIIGWLGWLNISISKKANNAHKLKIHKKDCLVKILVVPTNEELAMVDQFLERNK